MGTNAGDDGSIQSPSDMRTCACHCEGGRRTIGVDARGSREVFRLVLMTQLLLHVRLIIMAGNAVFLLVSKLLQVLLDLLSLPHIGDLQEVLIQNARYTPSTGAVGRLAAIDLPRRHPPGVVPLGPIRSLGCV